MTTDTTPKVKLPLYIYDGALPPADYREPSIGTDSIEIAEPVVETSGFLGRDFQRVANTKPGRFDWIFGVVMPVVCIFLDPVFFSTYTRSQPLWGGHKPFVYVLSFTSILAMMAWLIWGNRLRWANAFFGGLFLVGGIVSFVIGLFMLPYSVPGLVLVLGALGFTPFFTGVAFIRNGCRAIGAAESVLPRKTLIYIVLLSALASAVIPYVVNAEIDTHFPQHRPTLQTLLQD